MATLLGPGVWSAAAPEGSSSKKNANRSKKRDLVILDLLLRLEKVERLIILLFALWSSDEGAVFN
jgi:hypothetical protein